MTFTRKINLQQLPKKLELTSLNLFLCNYTKYIMYLLSYKLGLIVTKIHSDLFRIINILQKPILSKVYSCTPRRIR